MSSRTIFGTILAISATVILISQFLNNSATTTETFINYPLKGHLHNEAFVSSGRCEPKTVIGATVRLMSPDTTQSEQEIFSSFAEAAGKKVEHPSAKKSKSGCQTNNALESLDLPISGFTSTGSSPGFGDDEEIGAAYNASRLMYSTLKRKSCGPSDMIRGDLKIKKKPIVSIVSGKESDLEAGALAHLGSYEPEDQMLSSTSNRGVKCNELTGEINGYASFE